VQHPTLYEIIKAFQQAGIEGAVRALGLARRTVVQRLATASADDLKTAYQRLLWDQQRAMQELEYRVRQLDAERGRLQHENAGLRAKLREVRDRPPRRGRRAPPGRQAADDPAAVLYVSPQAPLEVIEAAFRALAKQYHPDRGGSTVQMQRLNLAREQLLHRNGRPRAQM